MANLLGLGWIAGKPLLIGNVKERRYANRNADCDHYRTITIRVHIAQVGLCLWHRVAYSKAMTAFGAAASQHLPSVLAGHTGAEPVGVATLASAWLICPFHKGIPITFLLKVLFEERQKYICFSNPLHSFLLRLP